MHMTHAILVELDPDMEALSDDELRKEAQALAESATAEYADRAFDSRRVLTDEEARRKGLPGAVVLGRNDGDRFQYLLDGWAGKPWRQAVALVRDAQGLVLDERWLKTAWNGEEECCYRTRCAFNALRLVCDDYTFDAGFFSAPDGSPKLSQETRAKIRAHPERFALVFFDYHW
jgi:hypothetical protein